MKTIIDDLICDHNKFRRFLNWYETEVNKLRSGDRPDYNLLEHLAEYFLLFPDELHHKKEDIIYDFLETKNDEFSKSAALGNQRLYNLRLEHITISDIAATFKKGVSQALSGQELPRDELVNHASTYIVALRRHINQEEEAFFPRALASLNESDWRKVNLALSDLLSEEVDIYKARYVLELEKSLIEQYG